MPVCQRDRLAVEVWLCLVLSKQAYIMYPPHIQCSDAALHASHIGLSLSPTNAHIKLPLHRLATVKMSKWPAAPWSGRRAGQSVVQLYGPSRLARRAVRRAARRWINARRSAAVARTNRFIVQTSRKKRRRLQHGAAHPATRRDVIDYVAAGGGLDSTLLFIKHNLALINFKFWGLSVCITGTLCVISDKTMSRPNWLKELRTDITVFDSPPQIKGIRRHRCY